MIVEVAREGQGYPCWRHDIYDVTYIYIYIYGALTKFSYSSLMYFFPSSLVVSRICFLILICIYLLYLCYSKGRSHSV